MRFCLNTDCLGYMPFEEMLDTVASLGYESANHFSQKLLYIKHRL